MDGLLTVEQRQMLKQTCGPNQQTIAEWFPVGSHKAA